MTAILENLIKIPFALTLIGLLVLVLAYRIRDRSRRRREKHYIYRCKNCEYIYLLSKNIPMQSCPRCGKLNEVFRN